MVCEVKFGTKILPVYNPLNVTPSTFWLKCINLPKCTKFSSARKLKIADKKLSHELANTEA